MDKESYRLWDDEGQEEEETRSEWSIECIDRGVWGTWGRHRAPSRSDCLVLRSDYLSIDYTHKKKVLQKKEDEHLLSSSISISLSLSIAANWKQSIDRDGGEGKEKEKTEAKWNIRETKETGKARQGKADACLNLLYIYIYIKKGIKKRTGQGSFFIISEEHQWRCRQAEKKSRVPLRTVRPGLVWPGLEDGISQQKKRKKKKNQATTTTTTTTSKFSSKVSSSLLLLLLLCIRRGRWKGIDSSGASFSSRLDSFDFYICNALLSEEYGDFHCWFHSAIAVGPTGASKSSHLHLISCRYLHYPPISFKLLFNLFIN